MAISLFIAGDVVPKGITAEAFEKKGEQIFKEMKPYIVGSDFSFVNFEAPVIVGKATPIKKSGPCLGVAPSTVRVLKDVGFDIFTLANNHFFDHGQAGVENTINKCLDSGVITVGGGKNVKEARTPLMLEIKGKCIAIINACEHEFSIADHEHGGSNLLDLINMQNDITAVRKKSDFVVLIIHGGVENYHYPTPRMKRWYHHFVDMGADVVINHHQHCINGYEIYKGKPIFYGLGNFYFPWGGPCPESWNNGYAVKLNLDKLIGFQLIPYRQTKEGIVLRDINEFDKELALLNLPIADDFLLQQKFDEYIIKNEYGIKTEWLPSVLSNRLTKGLARRGYLGRIYKGSNLFSLKNNLSCESHYEKLLRLFEILLS